MPFTVPPDLKVSEVYRALLTYRHPCVRWDLLSFSCPLLLPSTCPFSVSAANGGTNSCGRERSFLSPAAACPVSSQQDQRAQQWVCDLATQCNHSGALKTCRCLGPTPRSVKNLGILVGSKISNLPTHLCPQPIRSDDVGPSSQPLAPPFSWDSVLLCLLRQLLSQVTGTASSSDAHVGNGNKASQRNVFASGGQNSLRAITQMGFSLADGGACYGEECDSFHVLVCLKSSKERLKLPEKYTSIQKPGLDFVMQTSCSLSSLSLCLSLSLSIY